ncbi:hypothetical protein DH2020_029612 [Rehmannia glutinosa]|uniref:Heparan-alpha-glucosaminide N-acetyltransferase catalytic domain-containing protein n=1 Tax=Rehmannia glutinosa TaxID=99300 RepID=A0ABR0VNX7_REHGL
MAETEPLLQSRGAEEEEPSELEEPANGTSIVANRKAARVASLDVFRGLCVFLMTLVDYAGSIFPIIAHAPWNGVHLADFVMPFFLFVAGVSVAIAYKKVSDRVEATWKALLRALKLFLLGIFLQGGYFHGVTSLTYGVDVEKIRLLGILQVKCSVRGELGPACNSAGMIDRYILGFDHLYAKPVYRNLKTLCTYSSLTAAVTCIIGLQYGHILLQLQVDVYDWRWLTCVLEWMGKHSLSIFILVTSNIVVITAQGFYLKAPQNNILQPEQMGHPFKMGRTDIFNQFITLYTPKSHLTTVLQEVLLEIWDFFVKSTGISHFSVVHRHIDRECLYYMYIIIMRNIHSRATQIDRATGLAEVSEEPAVHHSGKDYVEPPPAPFLGVGELKMWSFYRAVIAEFIATLLFLYVTVATVIGHKKLQAADQCDGVGLLGIAWAFGGMIFILVYCTAGISGGHINPAVTFGLFLARKVSLIRAVSYMVGQCLGAICGVGLVKAFMKSSFNRLGGGTNSVATGYNTGTAVGAEIIGTFVLVYTVFSATDPKRSARDSHVPVLAPLPIGFAVFMVHLATIPITGTGINPARSFGAAVIYNNDKAWDDQWIFWVGPFVGALAAAIYHQFVLRAGALKALGSFRSNPTN